MDGCEHAALDDTACSFCFGKMPSIWPSWPGFCCWAPWAQIFIAEIVYLGSYNVFTCNIQNLCVWRIRNGWMARDVVDMYSLLGMLSWFFLLKNIHIVR